MKVRKSGDIYVCLYRSDLCAPHTHSVSPSSSRTLSVKEKGKTHHKPRVHAQTPHFRRVGTAVQFAREEDGAQLCLRVTNPGASACGVEGAIHGGEGGEGRLGEGVGRDLLGVWVSEARGVSESAQRAGESGGRTDEIVRKG